MSNYENLLLEQQGKTAIITINREEKLNALNGKTLAELSVVLDEVSQESSIRGVIITGKGEKAFVAGADIKEFVSLNASQASELSRAGHEKVMDKIQSFSKPVIAAINGFALGGGLEVAMSCHIRVAVSSAKLGLPEVSLGIIPGYGGTQRLTQLVGRGKALEMIMTGDMIEANDGLQWGLINHVVESHTDLLPKAISILERTYSRSATGIAAAIEAVNVGIQNPEKGFEKEIELFGKCFESDDMKEGVAAFLEKRKPNF
ncbi:enoyl-CoA hydratase-related protein [Sphingobacterium sp. SGL-16]|uniref:enoyl-CoA hydratase-related protein n=1 Tax=Sphingobacterium sp. SGL-16 TaxID=2710883 RepID=UPI0013EB749E|nr:enoyl-CoA hydratase-related protein [Sphingobacterium sp. SGL-16]NGM74462.1 enoyl-CoA hydratase [Sphingobacterium sp. SGL-16]